jgi:hypothetical protein
VTFCTSYKDYTVAALANGVQCTCSNHVALPKPGAPATTGTPTVSTSATATPTPLAGACGDTIRFWGESGSVRIAEFSESSKF